jgi:hypothetical protein
MTWRAVSLPLGFTGSPGLPTPSAAAAAAVSAASAGRWGRWRRGRGRGRGKLRPVRRLRRRQLPVHPGAHRALAAPAAQPAPLVLQQRRGRRRRRRGGRGPGPGAEAPGGVRRGVRQGLTLVHYSAQLEPFLTQKHTITTPNTPHHPRNTPETTPNCNPCQTEGAEVELKSGRVTAPGVRQRAVPLHAAADQRRRRHRRRGVPGRGLNSFTFQLNLSRV